MFVLGDVWSLVLTIPSAVLSSSHELWPTPRRFRHHGPEFEFGAEVGVEVGVV